MIHIYRKAYIYAEPAKKGVWAFGGTILFTSNGIYPEFNTPIKLHDRNMALERQAIHLKGESLAYGEEHFKRQALKLESLAKKLEHL